MAREVGRQAGEQAEAHIFPLSRANANMAPPCSCKHGMYQAVPPPPLLACIRPSPLCMYQAMLPPPLPPPPHTWDVGGTKRAPCMRMPLWPMHACRVGSSTAGSRSFMQLKSSTRCTCSPAGGGEGGGWGGAREGRGGRQMRNYGWEGGRQGFVAGRGGRQGFVAGRPES